MNHLEIRTTDQLEWQARAAFDSFLSAVKEARFCKEHVGYQGVRIQVEPGEQVTVYVVFVLINR